MEINGPKIVHAKESFQNKALATVASTHMNNLFILFGILGSNDSQAYLSVSDLRNNPNYILYYINITRILITGVLPLLSLCLLNYLVYSQLVKRRGTMMTLGE